MKKIKVEVELTVTEDLRPNEIILFQSDVIDGFEISRKEKSDNDDITVDFYIKDAKILSAVEI